MVHFKVRGTQDCIQGNFQSSPFDKLRAGSPGLNWERVVLTQTVKVDVRANARCGEEAPGLARIGTIGVEGVPQRLKPNSLQSFTYGLKAAPFKK